MTAAADTNEDMADNKAARQSQVVQQDEAAPGNGAGLRDEAEKYLRALAGDHARLREDQWTAIRPWPGLTC